MITLSQPSLLTQGISVTDVGTNQTKNGRPSFVHTK